MENQKARQHLRQEISAVFDKMDKDEDDLVSLNEFRQFLKQAPNMNVIADAFAEIDTDGDSKISSEELHKFLTKVPQRKVNEWYVGDIFRQADSNGDGKVDKDEFCIFLLQIGYPESSCGNVFDIVAGSDNMITLQDFAQAFHLEDQIAESSFENPH